jgi:vacuolar-type H+-ATPase subunit E/Vma4
MPLDELVDEIEKEARKSASAIRAEQKAEVDRITDDAKGRVRDLLKGGEEAAASEMARQRKRQELSVGIEKNLLLVEAREGAIERELKRTAKAVGADLGRNYLKKILEGALKDFAGSVPKGETTITTSKSNARLVEGRGYKVRYVSGVDGFILSNEDGTVTLNAEMDRIVEQNTDTIRNILAARLFGTNKK